jgi:hypothetical protein
MARWSQPGAYQLVYIWCWRWFMLMLHAGYSLQSHCLHRVDASSVGPSDMQLVMTSPLRLQEAACTL